MEKINFHLEANLHASEEKLSEQDKMLLAEARSIMANAYAPYSQFHVGAALLLNNGSIVTGNNQENAAYPSGLCAERIAIFSAGSHFPGIKISAIAITAFSPAFEVDHPVAPCGACRQSMLEYELNQKSPIRILMQGSSMKVLEVNGISKLLPFHFHEDGLKSP